MLLLLLLLLLRLLVTKEDSGCYCFFFLWGVGPEGPPDSAKRASDPAHHHAGTPAPRRTPRPRPAQMGKAHSRPRNSAGKCTRFN